MEPSRCIIKIANGTDEITPYLDRWQRLYASIDRASAVQSPHFVLAAFNAATEADSRSPELIAIVAEDGHKLVGLWPAFREERHGRSWLNPPGFGVREEYSGPMLDPDCAETSICRDMLACATAAADVVFFTVPASHSAASAYRTARFHHRHIVRSPAIGLPLDRDDEAWMRRKSKSFREGFRYDRRRLEAVGPTELKSSRSAGQAWTDFIITWMFDTKRSWLKQRGITDNWLFSDRAERLVHSLLQPPPGRHDFVCYALTVDNEPAAAGICWESGRTLEFFMLAVNPKFLKFSPGNLLIAQLVGIAFRAGRDLDFRITTDVNKRRWADSEHLYVTCLCANRLNGAIPILQAEWDTHYIELRSMARRLVEKTYLRRFLAPQRQLNQRESAEDGNGQLVKTPSLVASGSQTIAKQPPPLREVEREKLQTNEEMEAARAAKRAKKAANRQKSLDANKKRVP
jgi:CelD/BcsL family acetyltransferase involved in cellulose biosynthesis